MAESLRPLEDLPEAYQRLVSALVATNLNLARSGGSRLRYPAPGPAALYLLASASITTRSYLISRSQSVLFFFLPGAATEEIILRLETSFQVRAGTLPISPQLEHWQVPVFLLLPPFFATGVQPARAALLAKALGEDVSKITFLDVGGMLLGAVDTADFRLARVARLDSQAAAAVVCYTRVAGSTMEKVTLRYEPATFLALVLRIAGWARSEYRSGAPVPLVIPRQAPHLAARRILTAAVRSWILARRSCYPASNNEVVRKLAPEFGVYDFRAEVVLRLRPDGTLAEKDSEDSFRLLMSVAPREEINTPGMGVSLGPPDFLVSGKLHQRMMETAMQDAVMTRLFRQSGLPGWQLDLFQKQLRSTSTEAVVFRVERDGDTDRDIFVLRFDWQGNPRLIAAVLLVNVNSEGDDDYRVRVIDDVGSTELLYSNIPGVTGLQPSPWLPRYLLALVDQLKNWLRAVEGAGD